MDLQFSLLSRSLFYQKIVQGERKAKCKANGFAFSLLSRSLFYQKIVQGERKAKYKANGFAFSLPSRRLSWRSKVCKASAKQNTKPLDLHFLCSGPSSAYST
ncbi:MAG: hypothetical protein SPE09_07475 [Alloprevotella sp.]|nr:hypothetical protein [Alloprevotella sp.]